MSAKSRAILKAFFKRGKRPTQEQFEDLIDSCLNLTDDGNPSLPYKRFNAILAQVGGGTDAPTAQILLNELGSVPVFNYIDVGNYSMTFDPNTFPDVQKIEIHFGFTNNFVPVIAPNVAWTTMVGLPITDATIVFVQAFNAPGEYYDAFSQCPVEIRVWP